MSRTIKKRISFYAASCAGLLFLFGCFSCNSKGSSFDWIRGTWLMNDNGMVVGETWTRQDAHHYQGRAFALAGKDSSVYENVVLEKKGDDWFYTVTATRQNDNKPVAFRLTSSENNTFIFENPEHDFPKRIIYRHIGKDSIHASIDDGGSPPEQESHFYFGRDGK